MMSSSSVVMIQKLKVDDGIPLPTYCWIAMDILRRAAFYRQVKDNISLYVMLLAFSSLVTEVIQYHRNYKPFGSTLEKDLRNVLGELVSLKPVVHAIITTMDDILMNFNCVAANEHCRQQLQWLCNPYKGIPQLQTHPAVLGSFPQVFPGSTQLNQEYFLRLQGYRILNEYPIPGTSACFNSNSGTAGSGSAEANVRNYNARTSGGSSVKSLRSAIASSTGSSDNGSAEVNVGSSNAVNLAGRWDNSLRRSDMARSSGNHTDEIASDAWNFPGAGNTGKYNDAIRVVNTSSGGYGHQNAPIATAFIEENTNMWPDWQRCAPSAPPLSDNNMATVPPATAEDIELAMALSASLQFASQEGDHLFQK